MEQTDIALQENTTEEAVPESKSSSSDYDEFSKLELECEYAPISKIPEIEVITNAQHK